MKFRPKDIDYQAECQRLRGQISAMHTKLQAQQRLLDKFITYVERQSGAKHVANGRFDRDHVEIFALPQFLITDQGKVIEYDIDMTMGG